MGGPSLRRRVKKKICARKLKSAVVLLGAMVVPLMSKRRIEERSGCDSTGCWTVVPSVLKKQGWL